MSSKTAGQCHECGNGRNLGPRGVCRWRTGCEDRQYRVEARDRREAEAVMVALGGIRLWSQDASEPLSVEQVLAAMDQVDRRRFGWDHP